MPRYAIVEAPSALSVAVRSGHAIGLQVAIYNPDIDADGSNGRGLAATGARGA